MGQISIRLPDDLAVHLKAAARERGRSVNATVVEAIEALVNPANARNEREELKERLRRAGLLVEPTKTGVERPSEEELAAARREARQGTPLSRIVIDDRGPR